MRKILLFIFAAVFITAAGICLSACFLGSCFVSACSGCAEDCRHTMGCKSCKSGHTHNYEYELAIEPTCTSGGQIKAACDCGSTYTEDLPPLGHQPGELLDSKQPTCTEEGYEKYTCSRCNKQYRVTLQRQHNIVEDPEVPATCEHEGMSAGSHCSECGLEIVHRTTYPALPHNTTVTAPGKAAGCLEAGLQPTLYCSSCHKTFGGEVIPATGHSDEDNDGYCDACGTLANDNATPIDDIAGLLAVADDPGGTYILEGDISIAGREWTPIGDEETPFTGKFFGNGHTISGLTMTVNGNLGKVNCGLFGKNDGAIVGLKLKDVRIICNTASGSIGGIAGINAGAVSECTVTNFLIDQSWNEHIEADIRTNVDVSRSPDMSIGAIAGVNRGKISGCMSDIFSILNNYEQIYSIHDAMIMDSYSFIVNAKISVGCIAGANEGEVKGCSNTGGREAVFTVGAQKNGGKCESNVTAYIGGIVGSGNAPEECNDLGLTVQQIVKSGGRITVTDYKN